MSAYRVIKFKREQNKYECTNTTTMMTNKTIQCTMNGSINTNNLFNLANYTVHGAKLEEEQMDAVQKQFKSLALPSDECI